MKNLNKNVTIIFSLFFTINVFSQLRIDNSGNTLLKFGSFSTGNDANLYLGDNNHYIKSKFGYGVSIGTAGGAEAIRIPQYSGKVGIYAVPSYTLDIGGTTRAQNYLTFSDIRVKTNIKSCEDKISLLKDLHGVSYLYNFDGINSVKDQNQQMHYGFIAQDLQKIFPELVYTDELGYLSVDYTSLIPILLEAVNNQAKAIDQLKFEIQSNLGLNNLDVNNSKAFISQNNPNPFKSNTVIKYFVPNESIKAAIYFYDMQGLQKKVISLDLKGESSIVINGGEFQPGMYLYSLIIDNKVIDTKRMILTNE